MNSTNSLNLWLILLLLLVLSNVFGFNMRLSRLSIDYGPRIIGVARGNFLGQVHPHGTIKNTGDLSQITAQILELAREWSVSEIVIGVPVDSDGHLHYGVKNFNGQLCLKFSKVLSSICIHEHQDKIKTFLFDERFTTQEATLRLTQTSTIASLDSMSAACLLERYVEDKGEGSLLAQPCVYPPPPDLVKFDYNTVRQHVRQLYNKPPTPNHRR